MGFNKRTEGAIATPPVFYALEALSKAALIDAIAGAAAEITISQGVRNTQENVIKCLQKLVDPVLKARGDSRVSLAGRVERFREIHGKVRPPAGDSEEGTEVI